MEGDEDVRTIRNKTKALSECENESIKSESIKLRDGNRNGGGGQRCSKTYTLIWRIYEFNGYTYITYGENFHLKVQDRRERKRDEETKKRKILYSSWVSFIISIHELSFVFSTSSSSSSSASPYSPGKTNNKVKQKNSRYTYN